MPVLSRDQGMQTRRQLRDEQQAAGLPPPPRPAPSSHIVHRRSVGRLSIAASVHHVPYVALHGFGAPQATQGGQVCVRIALDPFSDGLTVTGSFLGKNLWANQWKGVGRWVCFFSRSAG